MTKKTTPKNLFELVSLVLQSDSFTSLEPQFTNRSTCVDSLALTPFESVSITPRKERNERGRGGRTSSRWSSSSRFRISDTVNTRLAALTGSFSAHRRILSYLNSLDHGGYLFYTSRPKRTYSIPFSSNISHRRQQRQHVSPV